MTATGHALIGTAIAARIANPLLAIPIAITSHIIADTIPHWDTGTHRLEKDSRRFVLDCTLDVLIGFALSFLLIHFFFPTTNLLYAFVVIIAAQFFDWITAPYLIFKIKLPPFTWFYKFQKSFDRELDKPWGIVTQAGVVLLVIIATRVF